MNGTLLSVNNLSYIGEEMNNIHNLTFSLEYGKNIVLFGPENSGLDVIFSLIMGFIEDFDGEVLFKGKSVKDFDYVERHNFKKGIGYIHRDYGLISNMNVEENISLPLQYHSQMSGMEIKKYVDMIIGYLNLESCKKFRPVNLTRSEILKTAYGRAIALDPDILLVEHAFESQSPLNINSFWEELKKRAQLENKAHIFITYEPEKYLDIADTFIMLFGGRNVFSGSRDEFINTDNPYIRQYKLKTTVGPMVLL